MGYAYEISNKGPHLSLEEPRTPQGRCRPDSQTWMSLGTRARARPKPGRGGFHERPVGILWSSGFRRYPRGD